MRKRRKVNQVQKGEELLTLKTLAENNKPELHRWCRNTEKTEQEEEHK